MKINHFLIATLLLGLAFMACQNKEEKNSLVDAAATQQFLEERKTIINNLQTELDNAHYQLLIMREQVAKEGGELKKELEQDLKEAQQATKELEVQLQKVRRSTVEEWESVKKEMNDNFERSKEELNKIQEEILS